MPPITPVLRFVNHNGLILAVHQPVARQRRAVKPPARIVKPPVFGNPHLGIFLPLGDLIPFLAAFRCHFQHEIRRLALLRYQVALPRNVGRRIDVERDQQIRIPHAIIGVGVGNQRRRHLAGDNRRFPVAEMVSQRRRIPRVVYGIVGSQFFRRRIRIRPVGKTPDFPFVPFPSPQLRMTNGLGGHIRPRNATAQVGGAAIILHPG